MKTIPYGYHSIDEEDIQKVLNVLKSEYITQGPTVRKFEKALCRYTGARYAVAVANGTAALHLSILASGISIGDEVITSPISFVASANCIIYGGGKPVFADVDRDTININPDEIRKKITFKTKAIIPVHFAGNPCELDRIYNLAKNNNLTIIEDASHALGAIYKDTKIGSCRYSDMTIFSFHPVKVITTGEGGAILTNRKDLYEKLILLRNHGITKDPEKFSCHEYSEIEPWLYEMQELGFNYRLTDFQAALGCSQLNKIDHFIYRRREISQLYRDAFGSNLMIKTPIEKEETQSAYHLNVLQIDFTRLGKSKMTVVKELAQKKVGTQVHYIPIHTQPYYQINYCYKKGDFPVAEKYYSNALTIPLYPEMTNDMVEHVIKSVLTVVKQ